MSKFLDLINKQRSEKKEEKFEGTFLEYLEKLQEDSDIAKPAHTRGCMTQSKSTVWKKWTTMILAKRKSSTMTT